MRVCSREKGAAGEDRAAAFLSGEGYRILQRNYRTFLGEVDIVAVRDRTLVFVEVKSWNTLPMSEIEYSVDRRKQRRIIGASEFFLSVFPQYAGFFIRYDVIFLSHGEITMLENAFSEG